MNVNQSGCNHGPPSMANRFNGNSHGDIDVNCSKATASKDVSSREVSKDFTWLGTAWCCQKQLKHYKSFCRRGITISVHSFVYIMSEDMKRLIAYVEDLYEDTNSYKMVKVRWFDKVDEVGGLLPMDAHDREIFFSLGRQDLNVECIDGLAAVLNAQHFEKFESDNKYSYYQPYLCRREIDVDVVKPFDITQLQGYWSQEVIKTMNNAAASLKLRLKLTKTEPRSNGGKKRKSDAVNDDTDQHKFRCSGASGSGFLKDAPYCTLKSLYPGCHAEVLSQDSGIRGCWFRCMILKRCRDKIKVRYVDLQDADETGNLEEWIMLTRVAKPDNLGIRFLGRPMVRPQHVEDRKASIFDVGAIVDAWWHSGWWEGIVLRQENEGRLQVYFPGEKRVAEFSKDDLRQSLEWVGSKWNPLNERNDVASKLSSTVHSEAECLIGKHISQMGNQCQEPEPRIDGLKSDERCDHTSLVSKISNDQTCILADLTNDMEVNDLKWPARKRKRSASKRHSDSSSGISSLGDETSSPSESSRQLNPAPDGHLCKSSGDQCFMGAPVQVSNLVMSR